MDIVWMHGGLGNQMFQYAFYKKLKKLKRQAYIEFGNMNEHYGYELYRAFTIEPKILQSAAIKEFLFSEKTIIRKIRRAAQKIGLYHNPESYFGAYMPLMLKKRAGFSFLIGYWQSEKYFEDISADLRQDFTFVPFTEKKNLSLIQQTQEKNRISLHIRRGDYIKAAMNMKESALISYCQNAIQYMCARVKNAVFLVFSDDIPWCKKHILPPPLQQFIFVDWNTGQNSFRDMQLMSLCSHNIIANSTFSWWGAWLNPNPDKIVIAPEIWFTLMPKEEWKDIIPQNWIKMKNT